jgi:hypothetical protein
MCDRSLSVITSPWGFKSVSWGFESVPLAVKPGSGPRGDSGPGTALDGRQRFRTSECIRPVRLLEIDVGAVAHRAMWGYGVDPPADLYPHLGQVSRVSARSGRTAADGHHHAPGWCLRRSWCSWVLTARRHRCHPARYMKGPPQVSKRSAELARNGQLEAGLSVVGRCILQPIRRPGRGGLLPGVVSPKRYPDIRSVLGTAVDPAAHAWARPSTCQ